MIQYRFDLFFTYWMLIWFVLHMTGIVQANPQLAFIVGIVIEIIFIAILIMRPTNSSTNSSMHPEVSSMQGILFLFGVLVFSKAVPLAFLIRFRFKERIHWKRDTALLLAVFAAYAAYVLVQGKNPVTIYIRMLDAVQHGRVDPESNPGMTFIHRNII